MDKRKGKLVFSVLVFVISVFLLSFSDSQTKKSNINVNISPTPTSQVDSAAEKTSTLSDNTSQNLSNSSTSSIEGEQKYRVIKVVDGDTFDVDIDGKAERLRMIGIDTPETVDPRKSVQCFGKEASNKAKEILTNQFVVLEADQTQGDRDKYGRLLRYAFLPDGTNYGLFMISEGYAHEYTYRYPYKYQNEFKEAQVLARQDNKGLWSPDTCSGNK